MSKEINYNKLVRDKIPEIIESSGKIYVSHVADEDEYKKALLKKLIEEANEIIEKPSEEEIADILEVIDNIVGIYGFSPQRIRKLKVEKYLKRGGFLGRIILEKVIEI